MLLLVAAGLSAMVWLGGRRTRRHRSHLPETGPSPRETPHIGPARSDPDENGFDPADLAELTVAMDAIANEHRIGHQEFTESGLRLRLQHVIRRRCPVRRIAAAPIPGATRICFADGTGILVRSQQGGLALLVHQARHQPVCLRSCRWSPDGPELVFDYRGGQFSAVVVGFDQAD